jgi:diguanylate cyclase (GGDEF)-like protein
MNESRIADARGSPDAALRATEDARLLAQRAGAVRVEAMILTNLSDAYAKRNRPADALHVASLALPVVRSFNDQRAELALVNNSGLAKIGLGHIADGKQDMARVLDAQARRGSIAGQAATLREFGEALAGAGDARGALELYHRERKLKAEVMASNRSIVHKEMQMRYDAEAKQRSIELVRRDNALKTEALANRDLEQRVWTVAAALMIAATALALLLLRRVRETNRRLAASQTSLRVASQRDPLTQLANRRHFHAAMDAARHDAAGFTGALLLVDLDHFKRVNDGHGHAAGDLVLVEVARRLREAVRDADLVVRWGGEEFLVVASRLTTDQADLLAARILASVGETPILVDGRPLRVTTSIGYACFPLPPYGVPVPWEQAINLADMALYSAKSQGRNRAVGLVSASAQDAAALRAIEGDFERAGHEGRVTLRQTPGP